MSIEITIYYHDRPESSFDTESEAAEYLWPDEPNMQKIAREDLESFHETANRDLHLVARRTDEDAYKSEA